MRPFSSREKVCRVQPSLSAVSVTVQPSAASASRRLSPACAGLSIVGISPPPSGGSPRLRQRYLTQAANPMGLKCGAVPPSAVLRVGVVGCGAAGPKRRWRRRRPGTGDLDLPGSRPADRGRPDVGGDAGHASAATQERPEAGRLAPRGAGPAGGLRGRRLPRIAPATDADHRSARPFRRWLHHVEQGEILDGQQKDERTRARREGAGLRTVSDRRTGRRQGSRGDGK